MRTVFSIVVPALLVVSAAVPASAQDMSAEQLTRMLNGPPARPQPQPQPQAQAPATATAPAVAAQTRAAPAPVATPSRAPESRAPESRPPVSSAPVRETERPVSRAVAPAPEVRQPAQSPRGPAPLSAQAIAALPFRLDLNGAEIIERSAGAGAKVYSVRQGDAYLLMIYTGPQSQYPIYEGEQATVAGRVSTIVLQDGKRVAAEHLFRREDAQPTDIHVWLMVTDGPQAALAERIGQSVDPR